jgi:hypothetical protein
MGWKTQGRGDMMSDDGRRPTMIENVLSMNVPGLRQVRHTTMSSAPPCRPSGRWEPRQTRHMVPMGGTRMTTGLLSSLRSVRFRINSL